MNCSRQIFKNGKSYSIPPPDLEKILLKPDHGTEGSERGKSLNRLICPDQPCHLATAEPGATDYHCAGTI